MMEMDKPMNWQDNTAYCKRLDSNLIFLSDREKSKFLQNKIAVILEKNQLRSLTGGQSLGRDHKSTGWIFIGKSFLNRALDKCLIRVFLF